MLTRLAMFLPKKDKPMQFIDIVANNVSGSGDFKIVVHLHKKAYHTFE